MADLRIAIYVSRSLYRNKTLKFQEDFCRKYCHIHGITNVTLFIEKTKEKPVLRDLIDDISSYDGLVMYSLCVLSEKINEIQNYMDEIFQTETKLITPMSPGISRGDTPGGILINNTMMAVSISENKTWKEIIKIKTKDINPYTLGV